MKESKHFKIIIVGDYINGRKLQLIKDYATASSESIDPIGSYIKKFTLKNKNNNNDIECILAIYDTSGQEEYNRMRLNLYPQTNAFLLMFDLNNKKSFDNIAEIWHPELLANAPNVPIILLGIKPDNKPNVVSDEEINDLKKKLNLEHHYFYDFNNNGNISKTKYFFNYNNESIIKTKLDEIFTLIANTIIEIEDKPIVKKSNAVLFKNKTSSSKKSEELADAELKQFITQKASQTGFSNKQAYTPVKRFTSI